MPVFPSKLSPNGVKCLPLFLRGTVVKGFGRGSKQLGIPTANFSQELVSKIPAELDCGVYYGWASVNDGPVNKMVMSVGWNPYYKNEKKSVETHIMHKFDQDFYGAMLKVVVLGYLRPEKNFGSLDELVSAIKADMQNADESLNREEWRLFKNHRFFTENIANGTEIVRQET
ncbi:riboflavin kinase isoform X1 [Dermacentor andersoni]|uniref:riboflavin kinase isoform X1 n=1 Tax=Dermacentor andersoni TaxID=34620 RepID=UPI002155EE92|nr:riboflavin kinase-like isoform X1 [Dermacentor andersoni]